MRGLLSLAVLVLTTSCTLALPGVTPHSLRTEARTDPFGLTAVGPRLSWKLASEERGQAQSAYRILVASDPALLSPGEADLWDSGKVESEETTDVAYEGKPLGSRDQAFWKVQVWDRKGRYERSSEIARWTMGLLSASDWKAQWIGYDTPAARDAEKGPDFGRAKWIWLADEPALSAPKAKRYFRAELEIPATAQVDRASVLITADNSFSLWVNGEPAGPNDPTRAAWNIAGRLQIGSQLVAGRNVFAVEVENADVDPAGLIALAEVVLVGGESIVLETKSASWFASENAGAGWTSRDFDDSKWTPVAEVAAFGEGPWKDVRLNDIFVPPPRYLRNAFTAQGGIRRATAHVSSLGIVDLRINGQRVANEYFTPGWTDYDQRVYYRSWDVTPLLDSGENVVGAILADGWYSGYVGFGHERDHYGKSTRLLAQIDIEYSDGNRETVTTGPDWKATTGPLLEADFLMGESHDARLELTGWDSPGYDESAATSTWTSVDVSNEKPDAVLEAHPGPPVVELEPIVPVSITEPENGKYVLDMGQNFAGMVRIRVQGEAGTKIILRHGERLNEDGTLYTTNLRSARATDTYVLRGAGEAEEWQPRFTFHGFQYVEVSGWPGKPSPEDIVGIPLSSDTPVVGSFACSDEMAEKLFRNIYWTQRMNFIDVPTDCPQRDERLGWTGDAQVYIRTACMIADTQSFFSKWLVDLTDAQREDGQFPMIAPLKSRGPSADGGPAWADAGVVCPWTVYEVYGDKRVLARQYESMARFITFCERRCTPDLLPPEQFHCFGDWLGIEADTPKDVIFLAYFGYSTGLMARAAEALGKENDAKRYLDLFGRIRSSFNSAYVSPEGRIKGNTQACYVMALAFDLVEGEKRDLAARWLIEDIESRGGHLSTGFIGTKDLMLVLSKIGRHDVAYRLFHNTTFPSWGFSIQHGATSIWERWNGWTPDKGFGDPGMNSFAHYSFGAVYQWMCSTIGGIETDGPAFKRIRIAPRPGGKLTWARVKYDSIRGPIQTFWSIADDEISLTVSIPAGTTAIVRVPTTAPNEVLEGGKMIGRAESVRAIENDDGEALFEIGSGTYTFRGPFARPTAEGDEGDGEKNDNSGA